MNMRTHSVLHVKVRPALTQRQRGTLIRRVSLRRAFLFHLLGFAGCFLRSFMLVLQILELFTQHGLTHNRLQSSPKSPQHRFPRIGCPLKVNWHGGHGSLGDARLNAMTTYLPGFTYSTLHLTNSKRHACGHASAPRELQDCRTIFLQTNLF